MAADHDTRLPVLPVVFLARKCQRGIRSPSPGMNSNAFIIDRFLLDSFRPALQYLAEERRRGRRVS
jgi:hypothetical protein